MKYSYSEILKDIETQISKEYLPAFQHILPQRKIAKINYDVKKWIKAKNKVNYYVSTKTDKISDYNDKASGEFRYQELLCSTRARMALNTLNAEELNLYVADLENQLDKAKGLTRLMSKVSAYDQITQCCVIASGIEDEEIADKISLIRQKCEDFLDSAYMM